MTWWGWIAAGIGVIILIAQGIDAVKTIISPVLKLEKRVKTIEDHNAKDLGRFGEMDGKIAGVDKRVTEVNENMEKRFTKQEETNQAILKSLAALINHEIDGNGIDGLKQARSELLQHIIMR